MVLFFLHFFVLLNINYMRGVMAVVKASDLRQREIINITDGKRLGFINDLDIDVEEGRIRAIIVPAPARIFSVFSKGGDYVIPWEKIKKIGSDVILIELSEVAEPNKGD